MARAKDVLLHVLGGFGQEPFLYRSVEGAGQWVENLSLDSCATVANLGVELGAECTFLPPGRERPESMRPITLPEEGDPRRKIVNIEGMPPMVARPHSLANTDRACWARGAAQPRHHPAQGGPR